MQCYATKHILSKQDKRKLKTKKFHVKFNYKDTKIPLLCNLNMQSNYMQLTICNNYSLQPNTPKLKINNALIVIKSERILP